MSSKLPDHEVADIGLAQKGRDMIALAERNM
jgi:hypothetical protein